MRVLVSGPDKERRKKEKRDKGKRLIQEIKDIEIIIYKQEKR